MAIRSITLSKFDKFKPARTGIAIVLTREMASYASEGNRIIGTLIYDKGDKDYGWVVLGKDERGSFRAVEMNSSLTEEEATKELLDKMSELETSGASTFPQGD